MPSPSTAAAAVVVKDLKKWKADEQFWWRKPPRRPRLEVDFSPEVGIEEVVRLQRERALAFVESTGQTRALRLLEDARRELVDRIFTTKAGSFSEMHAAQALTQVEAVVAELAQQQYEAFKAASGVYSEMGIYDAVKQIRYGERVFRGVARQIPLQEASGFVNKQIGRRSVLRQFSRSVSSYGNALLSDLERELALMALTQESTDQAIGRLSKKSKIFADARWKAERIWRTEMANAYETAKLDTGRFVQAEYYPDLKKQLIATLDNRTGDDSIYVNQQKRDLDEPFTDNAGRSYQKPPNRPNDRETLLFVREEWEEGEGGGSGGGSGGGGDDNVPKTKLPDEELSDKALLAIEAEERKNIFKKVEHASVFDESGKRIFEKRGKRDHVRFTPNEISGFKGAVLTHNHPGRVHEKIGTTALSFSTADLRMACISELKEIRAASVDRVFRLRPPKGGSWNKFQYENSFRLIYTKQEKIVREKLSKMHLNGELTDKELFEAWTSDVWEAFAKETGLRYNVIIVGGQNG